jgi:DNA-binding MarR family transcriptional regulator
MEITEEAIVHKIFELFISLHRYNCFPEQNGKTKKSPIRGQGRVLLYLANHKKISQSTLSRELGIRAQSLGELITKLEKNGLIIKEPSADDKRRLFISLTPEGAAVCSEISEYHKRAESLFACLSVDEKNAFYICLEKIINNISLQAP